MTVYELKEEVESNIQDDSFSSKILSLLNRGVNDLADEIQIPGLYTSVDTYTDTNAAYVSMPENFHKLLRRVYSSANSNWVNVVPFNELLDEYPELDNEGVVKDVAVNGSNLYYQGIPTTVDTLTLWYYRKPTAMAADTDSPDGIPCFYHSALLTNFVCMKIFGLIEDGIEGQKVNTAFFRNEYERGKSSFITSITMKDTLRKKGFSA